MPSYFRFGYGLPRRSGAGRTTELSAREACGPGPGSGRRRGTDHRSDHGPLALPSWNG